MEVGKSTISLACLVIVMILVSAQARSERCGPPGTGCLHGQVKSLHRRAVGDKLAMKLGQDAFDKLTLTAHRVLDGNKKVHIYQKDGTYSTAIQDFKSVGPVSVTKFPLDGKNKGRIGTVGDRTILLIKKGIAGRPTIRILKHGDAEDTERIVYIGN